MTLAVRLEIQPGGRVESAYEIGSIEIINITTQGRMSQDYAWRIRGLDRRNKPIEAVGWLVDSMNNSAMELAAEVLAEWRSGRPLPIDNHGQPAIPEAMGSLTPDSYWQKMDEYRASQQAKKEKAKNAC